MEDASFDGVTMAQSPGDGSPRGLRLLQAFYKLLQTAIQKKPFPREFIKARALTSLGALSPAVAFVCSGRYVILGRWWFSWAAAGVRPLRNSNSLSS